MLESTSSFRVAEIIYNDGNFAIARGAWTRGKTPTGGLSVPNTSYALRWHEKEGIGYPNCRGYGQWLLLPSNIDITQTVSNHKEERSVTITFTTDL